MAIISTIIVIAAIFLIYRGVNRFDLYTNKKFKYNFFEIKSYLFVVSGYSLVILGKYIADSAYKINASALDGKLLIYIGLFIIIHITYKNFSKTTFLIGLVGSILQLISAFFVITFGAIFWFFIFAYYAQTKPVYVVNHKLWWN